MRSAIAELPDNRESQRVDAGQHQQPRLHVLPLRISRSTHPCRPLLDPALRTGSCRGCLPSLLPGLAREAGQPRQNCTCTMPALPPGVGLVRSKRRAIESGQHLFDGRARHRPSCPGGSSWELSLSLPHHAPCGSLSRGPIARPSTRGASHLPDTDVHRAPPNKSCNDSARYPRAGIAGTCAGRVWRWWCARTASMISSRPAGR